MLVEEMSTIRVPVGNVRNTRQIVFSARGLRKTFGGQIVLDDISLELKQGEVVLLRGENGSGKTTLLNILTGNLEPDQGELHISINGNREGFSWPKQWWKELNPFDHFTPERLAWEGVGRVWQDIRLFPTMTTLENVTVATSKQKGDNPVFALATLGAKKEEKRNSEKAAAWLGSLGLGDRLDSSCDKISLGQMKRVAIARAIQAGAKVLFLDEPLSGLDTNGISEVMKYLKTLVKEKRITLVIVEHVFNIPKVLELADTVWTLADGKLEFADPITFKGERSGKSCRLLEQLRKAAGENKKVVTVELPGGAKLTTMSLTDSEEAPVVLGVKDLVVKRGIRTVINYLSLELRKGQIAVLEAPNGWGKSSLLDAIAGIHPIESGKVIFKGEDLSYMPTYKRIKLGMAYLRSNQQAFPSLSVEEHKKLASAKSLLFSGLLNEKKRGSFLSGGEKQKLMIELLPDADLYLLDEPMIGLDQETIEGIYEFIRQLTVNGKTVLITIPESASEKETTNAKQ